MMRCATDPDSISRQRARGDCTAMICVTLLARAYSATVSAMSWPGSVTASPPNRRARRSASATLLRSASVMRRLRAVSTCSAVQGAFSRSASRRAYRTTVTLSGSPLTPTSTRSPAAHGPLIACACM